MTGFCEMCDRTRDGVETIGSIYGKISLCPYCRRYWRHQMISALDWRNTNIREYGLNNTVSEEDFDKLVKEIIEQHPGQDVATVGVILTDLAYTVTPDEILGSAERLDIEIKKRVREYGQRVCRPDKTDAMC